MNVNLLQFLTWSTVAGAIASAVTLAAVETRMPAPVVMARGAGNSLPELPTDATAAGPGEHPAASAAGDGGPHPLHVGAR